MDWRPFMDTQTQEQRKSQYKVTPESNLLAKEARWEIEQTGMTKIQCPFCHTAPEIVETSKGERTTTSCECGYLCDIEINP